MKDFLQANLGCLNQNFTTVTSQEQACLHEGSHPNIPLRYVWWSCWTESARSLPMPRLLLWHHHLNYWEKQLLVCIKWRLGGNQTLKRFPTGGSGRNGKNDAAITMSDIHQGSQTGHKTTGAVQGEYSAKRIEKSYTRWSHFSRRLCVLLVLET